MSTSRHSFLATDAGLASRIIGGPSLAGTGPDLGDIVVRLAERSAAANTALMRGDIDAYRALVTYTDDFTLMSPFGGEPSRSGDMTPERLEAMRSFFRNGTFAQQLVQAYRSPDLVVLALIERQNVEVGGLPAQDWPLRVTLVYRREGSDWRLAHRHADPLVEGIGLEQAASVARGEARGSYPCAVHAQCTRQIA